tara:strand:+ start:295 stop:687 length:393 start_codon:yes stop_codon:yes gene_type:complete
MVKLYHGSSSENLQKVVKEGFSLEKIGSGWGTTYGNGIYFSFDSEVAKNYSDDNNYVEVEVDLKPFHLKKKYSPTNKNDKRMLRKIKINILSDDLNSFISSDKEEVILFDLNAIKSIELISLFPIIPTTT